MKKFLALALTLALISALSISSFAYLIVGGVNGELTGDVSDGVADIPANAGANATTVAINVSANKVSNRYAVDIDITEVNFNIAGTEMVWDVNELQYVAVDNATMTAAPDPTQIKVYNRSDLPVKLATQLNPQASLSATECPMTVEVEVDGDGTIAKATPKNGATAGVPTSATVTITPTLKGANQWKDVATYFAPYLSAAGQGTYQIATISLFISAVTNP